ncbi:hypothetical protein EVU94_11245 [Flavobacteriaceae bacterium 144Ye]|nr:hypothetical protein EVU94_11245 [Flavobacteriaceae bacterium 144Ye]
MSKHIGLKLLFVLLMLGQLLQARLNGYALKSTTNFIVFGFLVLVLLNIVMQKKQVLAYFKNLSFSMIPKRLKLLTALILIGQLYCLFLGKTYYPFADVGMFREARSVEVFSETYVAPRYYVKVDDSITVIHLRKEHTILPKNLLPWTYNNEYTFSAAYHYKSKQENFEFLRQSLIDAQQIKVSDTIFIGLESVDYSTRSVLFNADTSMSIDYILNHNQYYGALYIPDYLKE